MGKIAGRKLMGFVLRQVKVKPQEIRATQDKSRKMSSKQGTKTGQKNRAETQTQASCRMMVHTGFQKPHSCVNKSGKNWVSGKEFYSDAVVAGIVQILTEMRADAPTYLPLCDVQISHLSSELAQAPRNNCWHDNR